MAQSVNNGNNDYKGTLNVDIKNDVNITSNYRGLMTAGIYQDTAEDNAKKVENVLHAGGKINFHVTGETASNPFGDAVVGIVDEYYNGSYHYGKGDGLLKISGDKGVYIFSDKGGGISASRGGESGERTLEVTSTEGDVSIRAASTAISSGVRNNADPNAVINAKSIINVSGKNVSAISTSNAAVVLKKNATLNIANTQENGTITLSGGNGIVADVSGENTNLNIGNGTAGTVAVSGQIKAADGAAVTVGANTTTVVNAGALGKNPFVSLSNGAKFTAEQGAKLRVSGAYTGKELYKTDNKETSPVKFWDNKNTSFDNAFQYLDDNGVVRAGITEANKASIAGFIAPSVAIAATTANDSKINPLITAGADSYNAAVGIGQAGGVQHSTYEVAGLFADALTDHEDTPEKDVWAKAFHSKRDVDGLGFDGGALNLDTQYNGAVAGVDLYQDEDTAAGVAIAYADGNISGTSGAAYTKNDAQYVGVSLYGRKDLGSYRLAGDLSYLHGSHDITQYNGGSVITADPDTNAWSLGVKALKDYDLGSGTLTPYIGARYLRLSTDGYTSSLGLSYGSEDQDLFIFPVGVDYSVNVQRGSWNIKPYTGLGYIWTTGGRDADQSVSFGTGADTFAYDITDAGSFLAKAGISAENDRYSFGLGYAYQNGSSVSSDTWSVQAAYKF